ncbi:hypothetical protein Agub_g9818, partial [Astrephomene gubernaculifera]
MAERRRGRRIAVQLSSWGPWLLPFVVLVALLALRKSIVQVISDGASGGAKSPSSPAAALATTLQLGAASANATAAVPTAAAAVASSGSAAKAGSGGSGARVDAPRQQRAARHCSNTCFKANDGVCDEGRPATPEGTTAGSRRSLHGSQQHGSQLQGQGRRRVLGVEGNKEVSELLCDLGTDCNDCGPWVGTVPEGWGPAAGPVSWLRSTHNASMFTRRTTTPRPFRAAITHHSADPDVSAMIWHYGAMEGGVTRIVNAVLDGQCVLSAGVDSSSGSSSGSGGDGGGKATREQQGQQRRRLVID